MREIEKQIIKAMLGNTEIQLSKRDKVSYGQYFLHGNNIATLCRDCEKPYLFIDDCRWRTNTTKSRLNALISYLMPITNRPYIYQKDYTWYIGSQLWTGEAKLYFNGTVELIQKSIR